ncbi:PhlD [Actinacidiphila acididurans]|uniref:PhlD n=1 Tax=Actinacidiphila acididurans TaxID=2784346 RepID=A0ABS2TPR0_9ACTN|nr:PhlD [Actinacidiphila acididurans]MBM9505330.1 PhlD [Actinacidiphila acididurans]
MLAPHVVATADVIAQIHADHPDHPRPQIIDRFGSRIGVETRRFVAPLKEVARQGELADRNAAAYGHVREMGVRAARQALADHHIAAAEIDAVVTSHSTGLSIPGLDVHLVEDLGLSPRVARVPMTQLGCAGGAQALVQASRLIAAGRRRVLVVISETLSTVYQGADSGVNALIYKLLFSDSAAACLVTDEPLGPGPGLVVEDTFEYWLPASTRAYYLRVEADGYHFDSTKAAVDAVTDVMPEMVAWTPDPEFGIVHPGGPAILDNVVKGLDVADDFVRHSRATLSELGNGGGVAIFDVMRRTLEDPAHPADGTKGVIAAFGPGFVTAALRVRWRD